MRFMSIEHSRQWMEANAPEIIMDGLSLRVDYSTSAPQDEDDWLCKKVREKNAQLSPSHLANTGRVSVEW